MAKHKTEIFLEGEFTTIDVILEGIEISLREVNDNEYYRVFNEFEIENPLDLSYRLKGWTGMDWSIMLKVDETNVYSKKGVFDHKGFVTFSKAITI